MFRISSESELFESFRELDRDQVQLPRDIQFPLSVRDYLSWTEPSGHRVYLIVPDPVSQVPMGVVFQPTRGAADTPSMCHWCHSVRTGGGVSLLSTAVSRDRRVGLHLCSDLNCKENARSAPSPNDFNEGLSSGERVQRVIWRMNDFAKRNLF